MILHGKPLECFSLFMRGNSLLNCNSYSSNPSVHVNEYVCGYMPNENILSNIHPMGVYTDDQSGSWYTHMQSVNQDLPNNIPSV